MSGARFSEAYKMTTQNLRFNGAVTKKRKVKRCKVFRCLRTYKKHKFHRCKHQTKPKVQRCKDERKLEVKRFKVFRSPGHEQPKPKVPRYKD